jgi:oxygen-independent coproporphyrinogen-3 oxidase
MSVDKWIDYSAFEASRIEHFYLGVTTREAAIELDATWEDARIAPSEGCLNATLVENEVLYEHAAGTHWYKFTGDLFEGEGSFSRLHVINRSAKTVNITAGGTVGCEYNIATRTSFKLPRRFDLAFAIPVWVVEQMKKFVDDDVTEFYLELTTDQPIAFSFGMDACEEAIPFDWTTGHTQEALTTQWYDVNIAPVLANEQQIKLTFTNHSDQTAWVGTLVSLNCPFKVALPLAFPIPAGMSVDKVIDYSYFAATRLDQLYVGVTTDSKISVKAEAQSAIAHPNDKAACATAKTLKVDENNIHPAGTSWYKVDGSLFANMERLPKFRFETVSGETTTVTVGATVGCDYNIATRGTVKMPGGLDMYLRAPRFIFSVIEKFIDDDVNEFYVELTTDKDVEFTMEANPGTTTYEKLKGFIECGVNRFSIGVQTIHENELKKLGRIHNYNDFLTTYYDLRNLGIKNINVDIMYGIPFQTKESFNCTLNEIVSLSPEHLSVYGLILEEGTPFFDSYSELSLPTEDEECDMYSIACEFLKKHEYEHYEISNYAKAGYQSKHNRKYWNCNEFIGVGVSAYSYLSNKRFGNTRNIKKYISGNGISEYCDTIDLASEKYEYAMLALRLKEGISLAEYKCLFSEDFISGRENIISSLANSGYIHMDSECISLTEKGFYVSNYIITELL